MTLSAVVQVIDLTDGAVRHEHEHEHVARGQRAPWPATRTTIPLPAEAVRRLDALSVLDPSDG